ncbi:MAG: inositol monophosphatase family protein, partial [Nocardioidaceae bacterium]
AKDDGARTGRSLMNAHTCQVSDVSDLTDASLSYSSLAGWEQRDRLEDLLNLGRRCWRTRAYGDFWSHVLVAEGGVDIAAEPELEIYDMAALTVIVEEAGGRFTGLDGRAGPHSGNAVSTNGKLHDQALAFLGALSGDGDPDDPPRDGGQVHSLSSRRRPSSSPGADESSEPDPE